MKILKKFVERKHINKNKGGKMERKKTIKKSANRGFRSKTRNRLSVSTDETVGRNRWKV